ncbi:MAG: 50S ribosomal protein L6 [Nanoarchaeota archaeon]
MRKELYKKIEIPAGISAEIEGTIVKITGPEGENTRNFRIGSLELKKSGNEISIGRKKATKNEKKLMNTIAAHIKNMINGVREKFEYELKAVFNHFPMTIEVKGREVSVKNFLGEKIPRKISIPLGVEIEINGNVIKVKSTDRELAGQAAANLENVTRIRLRDRRVFQDGIFMTKKPGRDI